jgi:PPOX class probable F420-dependent enzyme
VDPELLHHLLAEARVGHLATVDADGNPHVVPVCFVLEREAVYWAVDQKPKASRRLRRLANIRARPVAELVVDHYAENWGELWWVRVSANAAILQQGREAEHALDLLAAKYEQYRERRPEGPVVRLAVRRWSGWSAADEASVG